MTERYPSGGKQSAEYLVGDEIVGRRSFHETGEPDGEWPMRQERRHGIERQWKTEGRLQRGYPKYWVNDRRVSLQAYVSACERDPTLPPFQESDNAPERRFPPAVAAALGPPK